jgi:group II intron reverse transcriptase/maturase
MIQGVTLDGITLNYLLEIQKKLKDGKFKFEPTRSIQIPKPGKTSMRPLTREKIVQKAVQLVLEPIYENIFMDYSHGFRPGRGTRTAIQFLESKFKRSKYIIEADFRQAFPSISQGKLLDLLRTRIKCNKTISLICSGLHAGSVEMGQLHEHSVLGTPQGSILSPLLSNIYLHELDKFMDGIIRDYPQGTFRRKSKEYEKLENKLKYFRKMGYDQLKPFEFRILKRKLLSTPSMRHDSSFCRVVYVRYADDFIIGVEGNFSIAKEILDKVSDFVEKELALSLNPNKTGIVDHSRKPVNFLGYKIMTPKLKYSIKGIEHIRVNGRMISGRKKVRTRINMD